MADDDQLIAAVREEVDATNEASGQRTSQPDDSDEIAPSGKINKRPIEDRVQDALGMSDDGKVNDADDAIRDDSADVFSDYQSIVRELSSGAAMTSQQAGQIQQDAFGLMAQKQQLDQEHSSIDWVRLEQQDPGLAALTRQRFNEAYGGLQGGLQQIMGVANQQQAQAQQAANKRAQENEAILERLIPAWQDKGVRSREMQALGGMLKTEYGFNQDELNTIDDPRIAKVLRDLKLAKQKLKKNTTLRAKAKTRARRSQSSIKPDKSGRYTADQITERVARVLK